MGGALCSLVLCLFVGLSSPVSAAVVGLEEAAALVLQVGAPGGRGADVVGAGVLDAFQLGQQVVFDGPAVGVVEVDGLVQVGDAFLHGFDEDGFESAVVVRWRRAQKK